MIPPMKSLRSTTLRLALILGPWSLALPSSLAPSERVAQRHARRVRFVQRQRAPVSQQRHYRARHLLLARAARTHHRLLHAQRCVFENRFLPQRRRRNRRPARRTAS